MNLKIKILKTASYINLFSILLFVGIVFFEVILDDIPNTTSEDLLGFLILFLVITIYITNFYYAAKLVSSYNKEFNPSTWNNKIRITFYVLEIILAICYSIAIYYVINEISFELMWPISMEEIRRVAILLCFFTGYLSSLLRLILIPSALKTNSLRNKQYIDQFGKTEY